MNITLRQNPQRRKASKRKTRARHKRLKQQLQQRQRRIRRRLQQAKLGDPSRPALTAHNLRYDISDRCHGIAHGGIGTVHRLAHHIGLIKAIDDNLHLLTLHLPYHESDHVLNFAYNALCDGTCLDDMELRRNDENFCT